jgi:hypothetical protein
MIRLSASKLVPCMMKLLDPKDCRAAEKLAIYSSNCKYDERVKLLHSMMMYTAICSSAHK